MCHWFLSGEHCLIIESGEGRSDKGKRKVFYLSSITVVRIDNDWIVVRWVEDQKTFTDRNVTKLSPVRISNFVSVPEIVLWSWYLSLTILWKRSKAKPNRSWESPTQVQRCWSRTWLVYNSILCRVENLLLWRNTKKIPPRLGFDLRPLASNRSKVNALNHTFNWAR